MTKYVDVNQAGDPTSKPLALPHTWEDTSPYDGKSATELLAMGKYPVVFTAPPVNRLIERRGRYIYDVQAAHVNVTWEVVALTEAEQVQRKITDGDRLRRQVDQLKKQIDWTMTRAMFRKAVKNSWPGAMTQEGADELDAYAAALDNMDYSDPDNATLPTPPAWL